MIRIPFNYKEKKEAQSTQSPLRNVWISQIKSIHQCTQYFLTLIKIEGKMTQRTHFFLHKETTNATSLEALKD